MPQVPVADGLFTWPSDDPQLIGGKCADCGQVTFPNQASCPRCSSTSMGEHPLPRRGVLGAWTTQNFQPPAPPYTGPVGPEFTPFGIGFVRLGDEVQVESRLTVSDPAKLSVGMDVKLVIEPFGTRADGTETLAFAFAPVEEG